MSYDAAQQPERTIVTRRITWRLFFILSHGAYVVDLCIVFVQVENRIVHKHSQVE